MKKIMLNDKYGLTQAVLEGRKTQTRRLVQDEFFTLQWDVRDDTLVVENEWGEFVDIRNTKYCMFKVGEIVAVAQSYRAIYDIFGLETIDMLVSGWKYQAGWTNKMFVKPTLMPYQIRITNVRIEKLQDISWEDCLKEGIEHLQNGGGLKPYSFYDTSIKVKNKKEGVNYGWYRDFDTPREAFASLIDKVSGKGTWDKNPYVFVYDFELVQSPTIDDILEANKDVLMRLKDM